MEMGLLTRFAPSMELPSRMHPTGGLLVSHGDWRRQDNWGVPLRFRFLASEANSVSSVSARAPQYFLLPTRAGCHWEHSPSSARKDDMLQNSARCSYSINNRVINGQDWPVLPSFATALNKHKMANHRKEMLVALEDLKVYAKEKGYCDDEFHAKDLLSRVMWPLANYHQRHKNGSLLDDLVVKESLEVAHLLLQNAPEEILNRLYKAVELKPTLDMIIRGNGGSADYHQVIELANQILAKLP